MEDNSEFRDLIGRVRAGDEEAARELLSQYEDSIRRIIRVRMTDPALRRQMDSVDVCQSVMADFFVRTALGQFDFDSPNQLIGLLATMARNRLINHVKMQKGEVGAQRRVRAADALLKQRLQR